MTDSIHHLMRYPNPMHPDDTTIAFPPGGRDRYMPFPPHRIGFLDTRTAGALSRSFGPITETQSDYCNKIGIPYMRDLRWVAMPYHPANLGDKPVAIDKDHNVRPIAPTVGT